MRITGLLPGFFFLSLAISPAIAQDASPQVPSQNSTVATPAAAKPPDSPAAASGKSAREDSGPASDRKIHLRLGPIAFGAGYTHISGPAYSPFSPYDYYPLAWEYPAFWNPYWGPYPFFAPGYFAYGSAKGEVRLSADPRTAQVYLDKAYAGTADHLKNIWLEPGAYDLSLTADGRQAFHQRIYVLSGKSVRITARLAEQAKPADIKE